MLVLFGLRSLGGLTCKRCYVHATVCEPLEAFRPSLTIHTSIVAVALH